MRYVLVATSHQSKSSHGLPYQMFVAATDTFLPNQPDSADSAPAPKQLKAVAESTSHQLKSVTEQSKAPADDIDVKLLDFLAVSLLAKFLTVTLMCSCYSYTDWAQDIYLTV